MVAESHIHDEPAERMALGGVGAECGAEASLPIGFERFGLVDEFTLSGSESEGSLLCELIVGVGLVDEVAGVASCTGEELTVLDKDILVGVHTETATSFGEPFVES